MAPDDSKQEENKDREEKRPYEPPAIEEEETFEALRLGCSSTAKKACKTPST